MANDEKMSREEAGRMGGEATKENQDSDFYEEIGKKGGEANSNSNGNNGNGGNNK